MSAEPGQNLTARQAKLLECLLRSATIAAAAGKAGISERSAYRWLAENPAFRTAYRTAKRSLIEQTVILLSSGAAGAVAVLLKVANDPEAPAGARVSAAGKVLELVFKSVELDDFGARLEAIEARLGELPPLPAGNNGRNHVFER